MNTSYINKKKKVLNQKYSNFTKSYKVFILFFYHLFDVNGYTVNKNFKSKLKCKNIYIFKCASKPIRPIL
jgi:hypothetical protein